MGTVILQKATDGKKLGIAVWIPYAHLKSHIDEDQDEVRFHIRPCNEGVIISFHNHIKSPTKEGYDKKNM